MKRIAIIVAALVLCFNSYASPSDDNCITILEGPETATEVHYELEYLGKFFITYYCICGKCNGYDKYGNPRSYDGFGNPLKWGTVATDKKVVPMHTKLVIEGYSGTIFEALDTGSHIDNYDIDIFVPVSHEEAIRMCKDEYRKVWKVVE